MVTKECRPRQDQTNSHKSHATIWNGRLRWTPNFSNRKPVCRPNWWNWYSHWYANCVRPKWIRQFRPKPITNRNRTTKRWMPGYRIGRRKPANRCRNATNPKTDRSVQMRFTVKCAIWRWHLCSMPTNITWERSTDCKKYLTHCISIVCISLYFPDTITG